MGVTHTTGALLQRNTWMQQQLHREEDGTAAAGTAAAGTAAAGTAAAAAALLCWMR